MDKRNRNTLLIVLAVVFALGGGTFVYLKKKMAETESMGGSSQTTQPQ